MLHLTAVCHSGLSDSVTHWMRASLKLWATLDSTGPQMPKTGSMRGRQLFSPYGKRQASGYVFDYEQP